MEHLAIMTHGYIEKILSGMKTIESRFSANRIAPYGKISKGDIVYLQETGKKVTASFNVCDVLYFSNLSPETISDIKQQYGKEICADDEFWEKKQNSRYATLIFISDPQLIEPFEVYKKDRSAFKSCNSVRNDLVINKRKIVKHCHTIYKNANR